MKKKLVLLLALGPALAFMSWSFAEERDSVKRPLDLPVGRAAVQEDKEEDIPETISFFGTEFEGNVFVWCFAAFADL